MNLSPVIPALCALRLAGLAVAGPLDELASPLQAARNFAASEIRRTHEPVPRSRWEPVTGRIRHGQHMREVMELLRPFNPKSEGSMGGGGGSTTTYRLDADWVLHLSYGSFDEILFRHELSYSPGVVSVRPPEGHTGSWTLYFANGQIAQDGWLQDGKRLGTQTYYYPDGTVRGRHHYREPDVLREDISYHRNGQIQHQGIYRNGERCGTWTCYLEDGTIRSKETLPD